MNLRRALDLDTDVLVPLINEAFALEKHFIAGDRTSAAEVRSLMHKGTILIMEDAYHAVGCIYVELRADHGYFGFLSVDPTEQGRGYGRALVKAAEDHCRAEGCTVMDLRIVNLRTELPAFYRRLGYFESGFEPYTGASLKPCHFVRMSKPL